MERFFRRLKTEWVPEMGYGSLVDAQRSIVDYITGYYSQTRPHQHNGGLPPNKAEEMYWNSSKSEAETT
ncbi:MAG: putative transposase [Candidatus Azotimanducaceae bacterium]|jgi:putative transposase